MKFFKSSIIKSKIGNSDLEMQLLPKEEKSEEFFKKGHELLVEEIGFGLILPNAGNDSNFIVASKLGQERQFLSKLDELLTASLTHLDKLEKKPCPTPDDNARTYCLYLSLLILLALLILGEGMLATTTASRKISLGDLERKTAQAYGQAIFCSKYGEIPDGNNNTIHACIQNRTCQEVWPFTGCPKNNDPGWVCGDSIRYLCAKIASELLQYAFGIVGLIGIPIVSMVTALLVLCCNKQSMTNPWREVPGPNKPIDSTTSAYIEKFNSAITEAIEAKFFKTGAAVDKLTAIPLPAGTAIGLARIDINDRLGKIKNTITTIDLKIEASVEKVKMGAAGIFCKQFARDNLNGLIALENLVNVGREGNKGLVNVPENEKGKEPVKGVSPSL